MEKSSRNAGAMELIGGNVGQLLERTQANEWSNVRVFGIRETEIQVHF
jgi:hypothetical protein